MNLEVRRIGKRRLVVVVQAELLSELNTRVVVPLEPASSPAAPTRLQPTLEFNGVRYELQTDSIASLHVSRLGERVGDVQKYRNEITAAIDFLLQGF